MNLVEITLLEHWWLGPLATVAVYVSDYYLTIRSARLYHAGGKNHMEVEGSYELNPRFEADIDSLRLFSPRLLLTALVTTAFLVVVWMLGVWQALLPVEFYFFALGSFVCLQGPIHVRHIQNLVLFRHAVAGRGVTGSVRFERWLSLEISAVGMWMAATFFLLWFLLTGSWFLLGGAMSCGIVGLKQRQLGKQAQNTEASQ